MYVLIISLRAFVQIHIFVHIFEEIEPKQWFALYIVCYKNYTFNTSYKEFIFDVVFIEYYRLYLWCFVHSIIKCERDIYAVESFYWC